MLLSDKTKQEQSQFSAYCRREALPEGDFLRVKVYQELIWNIFESALSRAYPLTKRLLAQPINADCPRWELLVQEFIASGSVPDPALWRMPNAFREFVLERKLSSTSELAFLDDLMLFEWVEIELFMMPDIKSTDSVEQELGSDSVLVINPESRLIEFKYPVFMAKDLETLQTAGHYSLLCFRHPIDLQVRFLEISRAFFGLLCAQTEQGASLATFAKLLAKQENLDGYSLQDLENKTKEFWKYLIREGAALGTLPEHRESENVKGDS